jgi:pSer/pThr/pTyr-binding forkhead associated (FHA) protein
MERMLLNLVRLGKEDSVHDVVLGGSPVLVGRAGDAHFRLLDPEASRRHCEIYRLNGTLVVRDLESTNGTFVNGSRVTESLLLPGDRLTLGASQFLIQYEREGEGASVLDAELDQPHRSRPIAGRGGSSTLLQRSDEVSVPIFVSIFVEDCAPATTTHHHRSRRRSRQRGRPDEDRDKHNPAYCL